jgi:hypothetical protein
MASAVDICNLALSHLGARANVSSIEPPEGSPEAEHCAHFYPIARDSRLESHPWKFAVKRVRPALLADSPDARNAYALPVDLLRVLDVQGFQDAARYWQHWDCPRAERHADYEIEISAAGALRLLTPQDNAVLLYIARVVDTGLYSPLFIEALSWRLASHLAGPILKAEEGAKMAQNCFQTFRMLFGQAAMVDANQRRVHETHIPDWLRGR